MLPWRTCCVFPVVAEGNRGSHHLLPPLATGTSHKPASSQFIDVEVTSSKSGGDSVSMLFQTDLFLRHISERKKCTPFIIFWEHIPKCECTLSFHKRSYSCVLGWHKYNPMFSCKWRGCLWHGSTTNEQSCKRLVAGGVCVSSRWRKYVCHKLHCPSSVVPAGCLCLLSINWNDGPSNCFFWHMLRVRFFQWYFSHVTPLYWKIECNISIARQICVSGRMFGLCEESDQPDSRHNNPLLQFSFLFFFLWNAIFTIFTCELWPFPWQAMLLSYSVEGELL